MPDITDTIVALATPAGTGGRAIIRLSGPKAFAVVEKLLGNPPPAAPERSRETVSLPPSTSCAGLFVTVYRWPAPATYTGQDLVELHLLSSPPLVERLIAQLLAADSRPAEPGEFTLRAFLAGKFNLARAEAVQAVIQAEDRDELRTALAQMAGGATRPLETLRHDLLDLLADIEAGLDFADEDIRFIAQHELLGRLTSALAQVTLAKKHFDQRALGERPIRIALAGAPNAGKSSLLNALTGTQRALVSPEPGTTRDYIIASVRWQDIHLELIDTAGDCVNHDPINRQAQDLGHRERANADLVVRCVEAGQPDTSSNSPDERTLIAATKCDLAPAPGRWLATSSVTGQGIDELRAALIERARGTTRSSLAFSIGRCAHHVDLCLEHLRRAHAIVLYDDPFEILAMELRSALDQLGEMVGAVYTDDLLDRIFSRFCIGK